MENGERGVRYAGQNSVYFAGKYTVNLQLKSGSLAACFDILFYSILYEDETYLYVASGSFRSIEDNRNGRRCLIGSLRQFAQ